VREVVTVIPCYREPIAEVTRSLDSALSVSDRAIIVDDGAGQADLDTLAGDRVTVVHRAANGGPSAALNDGIAAAPEDAIICRLDVRDVFYSEPKRRQIALVASGQARASCSPHFDPVAGADFHPPADWQRRIYTDSCFTGVSTVYERSVWAEVGIDTSFRWAEDWRFSLLIHHYVGFAMFPEVTCSAGMFPGGHTDCSGNRDKFDKREADRARVVTLGQILSSPDKFAHLYNERWCKKRGIAPMRRPNVRR
jgi:glycosyltransferase involved in cell wall biosynthesis